MYVSTRTRASHPAQTLRDRFRRRFPEIESFSLSAVEYARAVLAVGDAKDLGRVDFGAALPPALVLAMAMPASTTAGEPLGDAERAEAARLATLILEIGAARERVLAALEGRMADVTPNVTAIVGTRTASLLVGAAGGVAALARIPAGNIMVLGRSRKELAGFSLAHVDPHAGFLAPTDLVASTPPQYRRQAQRLVANKVALAARIDAQRHAPRGEYGRQLRAEIIAALERLSEPAAAAKVKPIPPPPIEPSKKRGGRRARKQKELYAQTEVRKLANRVGFGEAEEEIVVGSSVVGLGELGAGSARGRVRAPPIDNRLRDHIKRLGAGAGAGKEKGKGKAKAKGADLAAGPANRITATTTANNMSALPIGGTATSLSFTPSQGIQLQTVGAAPTGGAAPQDSRYFGSHLSFRK